MLHANTGQLIYSEKNVNIPGKLRPNSAYDLNLYPQLGSSTQAVLVVSVICAMKFVNGKTPGLSWLGPEKTKFMTDLEAALVAVWSEKHELKTVTPTALAFSTIGVRFDITLSETLGATSHSHWSVSVEKIPAGSFKTSAAGMFNFTGLLNGNVDLDSEDLTPASKGGPEKQRGAMHEFGHMMGYFDEYVDKSDKPVGVPAWTSDLTSIMNCGETVQGRHYIWFADWCNRQYITLANLSKKPIEFKVDGAINMAVAQI